MDNPPFLDAEALVTQGIHLEHEALAAVYGRLGRALEAAQSVRREDLQAAIDSYQVGVEVLTLAQERDPLDTVTLELLAQAEMGLATIVALVGRDPQPLLLKAEEHLRAWLELDPSGPVAARALAHHQAQAARLVAFHAEGLAAGAALPPAAVHRWRQIAF